MKKLGGFTGMQQKRALPEEELQLLLNMFNSGSLDNLVYKSSSHPSTPYSTLASQCSLTHLQNTPFRKSPYVIWLI